MKSQQYRYFIELQPQDGVPVPRALESEARRTAALAFIGSMREWLKQKHLDEKVSDLGVTVFGQVRITCEAAVIKLIRDHDDIDIAAIRQGATYLENPGRWNEMRQA